MAERKHTTFTPELADAICKRVSEGETIAAISREPAMPCRATIHNWMCSNEKFKSDLLSAIELRADHWAEETITIADNPSGDTAADRLRIDTRKWLAQKLYRKRYGDHQEIEHKGEIGNLQPILNVTINGNQSRLAPEAGDSAKDAGK